MLHMCHGGCSSDIASSYFLRASKVWSMLHHGSVGASSEYKKRNLTLNPSPSILPSIVFYDKI